MSDEEQHKNKAALSPQEAAGLLRRLAEQLEKGVLLLDGQQVRMDHALVLEQALKAEEGGLSYRLKLKYKSAAEAASQAPAPPKAPSPAAGGQAPSFKGLKKALSGPFKQIQATLAQGGLPAASLARGLLATCQELLTLPQAGGQGFQELAQQARLLLEAVEQGDAAQAGQATQAMGRLKSVCHAARK